MEFLPESPYHYYKKINTILQNIGILDFLSKYEHIYIGGSLPGLVLGSKDDKQIYEEINDVDIYTTNSPMLLRDINKKFKPQDIIKTGVNVSFYLKKRTKHIQIITSGFENFNTEVLEAYDCDMISVGYHPNSQRFIINNRFIKGYKDKNFVLYYERSNLDRIEKLTLRAKKHFGSYITVIKETPDVDYRPYWKNKYQLTNITDVDTSPPYTQIYCSKYKCCICSKITEYLVCKSCDRLVTGYYQQNTFNNFPVKDMVVFGGVNGFGNIIANQAVSMGINVSRTTRSPKTKSQIKFDLTNGLINPQLMTQILNADCVVFNAYQTLENDHSIWTKNINTFDEELALERFKVNCFGYVKILQQIIKARKEYITNSENKVKDIVFVCMDANESLFEGKLQDGKHIELNMAKTAWKQIFYTNAQVLASLGIITVFFNVNWLSYHGISVDQIASKSKFLIPPYMCAKVIINYIKSLDLDDMYSNKNYIHSTSFYKLAKSLDLSKVNIDLVEEEEPIDKLINLTNKKEEIEVEEKNEIKEEKGEDDEEENEEEEENEVEEEEDDEEEEEIKPKPQGKKKL
jgi:hypothetical protein